MTVLKGLLAAVAGTALLAAPVAASAAPTTGNPAASLSVARAAAPAAGKSKIGASVPTATLVSIGVLAALVAVVLVATDGGDNSASN
ncbi:hypothetical protein D9601_08610 [Sphingomonas sp. MA1305]|uniref:hypothetical protein n=1 Tax=Sphingomonas sp. MA1305 TaxID=2479204 RepID=UPI0018DF8796|nr:hypothetical protein [Sphingomonas sp. MA1305]MBI0475409.1 hypothetical protein [Sphingomonas sp. MA1305]